GFSTRPGRSEKSSFNRALCKPASATCPDRPATFYEATFVKPRRDFCSFRFRRKFCPDYPCRALPAFVTGRSKLSVAGPNPLLIQHFFPSHRPHQGWGGVRGKNAAPLYHRLYPVGAASVVPRRSWRLHVASRLPSTTFYPCRPN